MSVGVREFGRQLLAADEGAAAMKMPKANAAPVAQLMIERKFMIPPSRQVPRPDVWSKYIASQVAIP